MSTAPSQLPTLGVALPLGGLMMHRDWIIERQRDLELQDFFEPEVLSGDWKPLAARIKRELDGYRGRLGIHGPFWGFSIATKDSDVAAIVTKRMHQGLDVCAAVGANQMVIHSPYTTWDYHNLDYTPGARTQLIERVHGILGTAVKRAETMGCTLVIENIEDKDAHARVEAVQQPGSGVFDRHRPRQLCPWCDGRSSGRLLCPCGRRHAASCPSAGYRRLRGPALEPRRRQHCLA